MIPNCDYCGEQTRPESIFYTGSKGREAGIYYCSAECATSKLSSKVFGIDYTKEDGEQE